MPRSFGEVRRVDEEFHRTTAPHGKWVNGWTVDVPEEMRRHGTEGVGGIMTDRPDLNRQILDATPPAQ
jgi:glycerophosphoryl diester phosphodiesterase